MSPETETTPTGTPMEKKEIDIETTPEMNEVMDRYIHLKSIAEDPRMSPEDREDVATEILDLFRVLEKGEQLPPDFQKDMLAQLKQIESGFAYVKKLNEAMRNLQRESDLRTFDPAIYAETVELYKNASDAGISESILEYFKPTISDYLAKIQAQQGGENSQLP